MVPRVSSSRSLTADQQHRPLDSMDTGKGGRGGTLPIPLISPFPAPPPLAERGEEVRVQEVVGQGEGGSGGLGTKSKKRTQLPWCSCQGKEGKYGYGYRSSLTRQVREEERETLRPEQWDSGSRGLLQFKNSETLKPSAKHWYTGTI